MRRDASRTLQRVEREVSLIRRGAIKTAVSFNEIVLERFDKRSGGLLQSFPWTLLQRLRLSLVMGLTRWPWRVPHAPPECGESWLRHFITKPTKSSPPWLIKSIGCASDNSAACWLS